MYRAALRELLVGESLDHLGPRWDVLHAVPAGSAAVGNTVIDHLVIGPPGVFALTSANFAGEDGELANDSLAAGAQSIDGTAVARALGETATSVLSTAVGRPVVVKPLLVVVAPSGRGSRGRTAGLAQGSAPDKVVQSRPNDDVVVVSSKQLVHYLERLDRTLDGAEIASISDVADRDTTWQAVPTNGEDVQPLADDFAALRAVVSRSTRIRILWGVVGLAIVAICVWVGITLLAQHP